MDEAWPTRHIGGLRIESMNVSKEKRVSSYRGNALDRHPKLYSIVKSKLNLKKHITNVQRSKIATSPCFVCPSRI